VQDVGGALAQSFARRGKGDAAGLAVEQGDSRTLPVSAI
jgi:hypothetical protein